MAAAPFRPPWFGNRGVQLLAGGALAYSLVQMVQHLVDGDAGQAFLSFAWCVLFGYVLVESLRFRREQDAAQDGTWDGTRDEAPDGPLPPAD